MQKRSRWIKRGGGGGTTPTPPTGYKITDDASFNAFLTDTTATMGVVANDFALAANVTFTNTSVAKTIELWGYTIDCNTYSFTIDDKTTLTFCDSSTKKGTIKGTGVNGGMAYTLITVKGTLSIKDGIKLEVNALLTGNPNGLFITSAWPATGTYGTVKELNANISVNNTDSSGGGAAALYVGDANAKIENISGGTYAATVKSGSCYGINGAYANTVGTISSDAVFTASGGTPKNFIKGKASAYPSVSFTPGLTG